MIAIMIITVIMIITIMIKITIVTIAIIGIINSHSVMMFIITIMLINNSSKVSM